jgi:hypothetical protein
MKKALGAAVLLVLVGGWALFHYGSTPHAAPPPSLSASPDTTPTLPAPSPLPTPEPVPTASPSVTPTPIYTDYEDPGCAVLACKGPCIAAAVRSLRSGTAATWSFCRDYPPLRIGPPPGWR